MVVIQKLGLGFSSAGGDLEVRCTVSYMSCWVVEMKLPVVILTES